MPLHCMETLTILVEVAYATSEKQSLVALEVNVDTTVKQAIIQSGLLDIFPEIDISVNQVGIFGERVALDKRLNSGDRVEIYRPLLVDPRQARIQRARRA